MVEWLQTKALVHRPKGGDIAARRCPPGLAVHARDAGTINLG